MIKQDYRMSMIFSFLNCLNQGIGGYQANQGSDN